MRAKDRRRVIGSRISLECPLDLVTPSFWPDVHAELAGGFANKIGNSSDKIAADSLDIVGFVGLVGHVQARAERLMGRGSLRRKKTLDSIFSSKNEPEGRW